MNTSVNPSMLIEQKRAELQVKLTILKENLKNLKNEINKENNINSASFINSLNITSLELFPAAGSTIAVQVTTVVL